MTTVVYRDGVIAGDTRSTCNDICCNNIRKIAQAPDGSIGGASGSSTAIQKFVEWFEAGSRQPIDLDNDESLRAIIVRPSGKILHMEDNAHFEVFDEFTAIGSGMSAVLGALYMGATAEQAVEASAKVDVGTGGGIMPLRLRKATTKKTSVKK